MTRKERAPWNRPNPRKRAAKTSKHLSPAKKAAAKARARRAGRRYPNLVDNMRVAASTTHKAETKRSGHARTHPATSGNEAPRRRSPESRVKDPKGGLTQPAVRRSRGNKARTSNQALRKKRRR